MSEQLIGVTEAAKRLKVSHSTISRNLRDGKIAQHGKGKRAKVLVSEVEKARALNLDPATQPREKRSRDTSGTYISYRTSLEKSKSKKAQIEVAGLLGQTVSREDVEDSVSTAARELRDALSRRWRVLAVAMAGKSAREIEMLGAVSDAEALAELVRKLGSLRGRIVATEPADDTGTTELVPGHKDPTHSIYKTREFKDWREAVLARAGRRCEWHGCGRSDSRMFADHIRELRDGGAPFDLTNGQCLCGSHHTLKTNEERARRYASASGENDDNESVAAT